LPYCNLSFKVNIMRNFLLSIAVVSLVSCSAGDDDNPADAAAGDAAGADVHASDGMRDAERTDVAVDGSADARVAEDGAADAAADALVAGDGAADATADAPVAGDGPADAAADAPADLAPDQASDGPPAGDGAVAWCQPSVGPGIAPSTPPGTTCEAGLPTITESGIYMFDFASSSQTLKLPCGDNLADRRAIVYGLRLERPQRITLNLREYHPTGSQITAGISNDCTTYDSCTILTSGADGTVALEAGLHYLVVQTFGDVHVQLEVSFGTFVMPGFASCAAVEQQTEACVAVPGTYKVAKPAGDSTVPVPACAASDSQRPGPPTAVRIPIIQPTQLSVVLFGSFLSPFIGSASLRSTCAGAELECVRQNGVFSRPLEPGTYTLVTTGDPIISLDPIAVQPSNLDCSSARQLMTGITPEVRVLGGPVSPFHANWKARYYKMHGNLVHMLVTAEGAGLVAAHLLLDCNDPTSIVREGVYDGGAGDRDVQINLSTATAGDYWLVVSAPEGSRYDITWTLY
jgi:hypothetical protein